MIYRKTYNLVKEKIREIQEEIKQNSKDIKRAADFGDLRENAEYHAAKENQVLLHQKLHRFEKYLDNELLESTDVDVKHVSFGTKVTYHDGEQTLTVSVAGSAEYELELFDNICTTSSPFAQHILGKQKGDVIIFDTPDGEKKITITDIQPLE